MDMPVVYQVSLVAAFIAGMVALFAPCCISYLLPAYLGNIFKEKKQILLMTLVYSLGIFVVMLPVVLGAKFLTDIFFDLHDETYIVGGFFMIVVALISLIGIKLPMPHFAMRQTHNHDLASTFFLGIFSGITSACCAPVLVGVIALSSLSLSWLHALGVGGAYVLGMVTPLYVASLFIHKRNILGNPVLKKKITILTLGTHHYPVFVSNVIAFFIFLITGILLIFMAKAGMLSMPSENSPITQLITDTAQAVSSVTKTIPGINLLFIGLVLFLGYRLYREMKQSLQPKDDAHDCCKKD